MQPGAVFMIEHFCVILQNGFLQDFTTTRLEDKTVKYWIAPRLAAD